MLDTFFEEFGASHGVLNEELVITGFSLLIILGFRKYYSLKAKVKQGEMEGLIFDYKALRDEMEAHDVDMKSLKTSLASNAEKLQKQRTLISDLFRHHYEVMDKLCASYFGRENNESLRSTILHDLDKEISRLRSAEAIENIRSVVNECHDNVIDRLKEEMPKLKDDDLTFAALLLAGLDARTVCLLSGVSRGNFYVKRSRFVLKLSEGGSKAANEILEMI